MANHELGRAAAQRIKDAVVPRRRHGDGVNIEFDGGVYDRFHDVAGSKDDRQQALDDATRSRGAASPT